MTGEPVIDTDVIIRLMTGDDPGKQEASRRLFKRIESGELTATAPDTVIADAVFVLSSRSLYRRERPDVRALLLPIVGLPGFRVEHKSAVLRALDIYATTNVDFGDAMVAATAQLGGSGVVYSYDGDCDRLGLDRRDPG